MIPLAADRGDLLFISNYDPAGIGGSNRRLRSLASVCAAYYNIRFYILQHYTRWALLNKLIWQCLCFFQAYRVRGQPVVCYLNYKAYPLVRLATWLCGSSLMFAADSLAHFEFQERFPRHKLYSYGVLQLEKAIAQTADLILCASPNISAFFARYNRHVYTLTNFVDVDRYRATETKAALRERWQLPGGLLIGLTGPFPVPFNATFLPYLWQHIHEFAAGITPIVIGSCPEKRFTDRIRYVDTIADEQAYIEHLLALDGLLIPSELATSGPLTKILDAFAARIPVYTTPKGAIGLANASNREHLFIAELTELPALINETLADDQLLAGIRERAYELVSATYSRTSQLDTVAAIYRDVSGGV